MSKQPETGSSERAPFVRRLPVILGIAALFMVAAAGLSIVALNSRLSTPAQPQYATLLPATRAMPEFTLVDGNGERFGRDRLRSTTSLVFFGFTHCPDVCPLTLSKLAAARARIVDSAPDTAPAIVFVSVDPERDGPEQVAAYVGGFGPGIIGVTGDLDQIDVLAGAVGAYHARPVSDDGYEVEHSAGVFVVAPDGRLGAVVSSPIDVDALVDDWPRIAAALK